MTLMELPDTHPQLAGVGRDRGVLFHVLVAGWRVSLEHSGCCILF